ANNADDPFPIWGTCMGFQLLTYLTSGENLLTDTNSTLVSYPLYFQQAYKTSKLFGSGSAETGDIINILSKENVTFNAHFYGITPKTFNNNTKLRTFYRMLTTNYDDNGKEFVSMIEAFKYPFYGAQWHPEKNNFEFVAKLGPNLHHSADAIKVTLYMAQFFVNEARKSSHKFKNATEEAAALIYNFPVVYTAGNTSYEQCYFF
ncbi:gamma-glutamyl hydrolase-like, partial [Saccoglossus kowalevskii]